MLYLTIPEVEGFDDKKEEFTIIKPAVTLQLEHSLISVSKWESKWCVPFFLKKEKTYEQTMDYIKCMTVTPNVKPEVYSRLTKKHIDQIYEYINAPMTATTFSKQQKAKQSSEIVTNELIYYWMIAYNIPSEYEKWHVNRLLTLIRVCEVKNQPAKKIGGTKVAQDYAALNKARKAKLNTKG